METLTALSLGVFLLYGIIQVSEGTCSCSSVTGDTVELCVTRGTRYTVGYTNTGWLFGRRRKSKQVLQYYNEYSCCSGYTRVGNKCHSNSCGGCGSNSGDSERACSKDTIVTRRESYSYSYSCGWWRRRKLCHGTAYRVVSDTVQSYSCCHGYELTGQTCQRTDCGLSRYSDAGERLTQIVGGIEPRVNEFPWQVRLSIGSGLCGGTVLSDEYILTAAHCVSGKSTGSITVVAGDHRRLNTDTTEQSRSVSRVYTDGYNRSPLRNDIAILRLSSTLTLGQAVRPACLPLPGLNFNNRSVTISGWGRTGTTGPIPNTLRYTRVYVTAHSVCRARYGNSIGPNVLCTTDGRGDDERSSCFGDSGGPMVLKENGRFIVIGVTSFVSGSGCAAGVPFGYVDVSRYLDWIEQITGL